MFFGQALEELKVSFVSSHNSFVVEIFSLISQTISVMLQKVIPELKWVRGEPLSQDHWMEMFRLLKMPKGTTLEKLTFGAIVQAADEIIANAKAIKVRPYMWFSWGDCLWPWPFTVWTLSGNMKESIYFLYHLSLLR